MASIQGKVAIVTGSARGIGAGIAARFGKEGVKVICLDRNPAAETVNHIKSNGGDAMAIQCDISKQASIEAAVRQVLDTYGTIDILVNSAGLSKMASITDATEADWDYVNNVTLKGTWLMIKGVAPTMKANKSGKIINIASISGCVAFVDQSIYCAAKGGVVNMTRELGVELAPFGIHPCLSTSILRWRANSFRTALTAIPLAGSLLRMTLPAPPSFWPLMMPALSAVTF